MFTHSLHIYAYASTSKCETCIHQRSKQASLSYVVCNLSVGFSVGNDIPANLGLRDQIAALQWIKSEIHAFGGDPNNVTIFGKRWANKHRQQEAECVNAVTLSMRTDQQCHRYKMDIRSTDRLCLRRVCRRDKCCFLGFLAVGPRALCTHNCTKRGCQSSQYAIVR